MSIKVIKKSERIPVSDLKTGTWFNGSLPDGRIGPFLKLDERGIFWPGHTPVFLFAGRLCCVHYCTEIVPKILVTFDYTSDGKDFIDLNTGTPFLCDNDLYVKYATSKAYDFSRKIVVTLEDEDFVMPVDLEIKL